MFEFRKNRSIRTAMMTKHATPIAIRLEQLEKHLKDENPVLIEAIHSFKDLDKVGYKTGLLEREESFATKITWWPLISVLGTFSAGKSTFINHFLKQKLQRSGNQAVDDKFTVICYSRESSGHALPGVALDSDPRFPFYRISHDIEEVAEGEGKRIDAYLQMKTCSAERIRGKILIDSPGFDADAQRTSTLRITDHIIDLSDLVLVFFDARHPEPGAMRDTLDHLVTNTISRPDSGKFLYILNQLDTAAREDNPEEVVAAWQRALGERGLTAGRFYTIYSPDAAVPIDNNALRQRFESKRDADLGEIHSRMEQVEVERAYRIVAALDNIAREIETGAIPALGKLLETWKKRTLIFDAIVLSLVAGVVVGGMIASGTGFGLPFSTGDGLLDITLTLVIVAAVVLVIHFLMRSLAAKSLSGAVRRAAEAFGNRLDLQGAFRKSTGWLHSIFSKHPAGWTGFTRKRLHRVRQNSDIFVQKLNDRFTNPSGADMVELQKNPVTAAETLFAEKQAQAGALPVEDSAERKPGQASASGEKTQA
jgi:hypothetical protein